MDPFNQLFVIYYERLFVFSMIYAYQQTFYVDKVWWYWYIKIILPILSAIQLPELILCAHTKQTGISGWFNIYLKKDWTYRFLCFLKSFLQWLNSPETSGCSVRLFYEDHYILTLVRIIWILLLLLMVLWCIAGPLEFQDIPCFLPPQPQ